MATSAFQTTFLAATPKTQCDSTGFYDTLITAKAENPSHWSTRPCNSVSDFKDGTLGCYGQFFRSTVVDYAWTIWQWQPKGSSKTNSGKRRNLNDSVYVLIQQYTDAAATDKVKGYCKKIVLKDATSLAAASAALVAGVLATLF